MGSGGERSRPTTESAEIVEAEGRRVYGDKLDEIASWCRRQEGWIDDVRSGSRDILPRLIGEWREVARSHDSAAKREFLAYYQA